MELAGGTPRETLPGINFRAFFFFNLPWLQLKPPFVHVAHLAFAERNFVAISRCRCFHVHLSLCLRLPQRPSSRTPSLCWIPAVMPHEVAPVCGASSQRFRVKILKESEPIPSPQTEGNSTSLPPQLQRKISAHTCIGPVIVQVGGRKG